MRASTYALLGLIIGEGYLTFEAAFGLDNRTLLGAYKRGLIEIRGKRFYVTEAGIQMYLMYADSDVPERKNPGPLSPAFGIQNLNSQKVRRIDEWKTTRRRTA